MVVNTAEERGCRILADILDNQVTATRVLVNKCGHVVDETTDDNQGTGGRLLLDCAEGQCHIRLATRK